MDKSFVFPLEREREEHQDHSNIDQGGLYVYSTNVLLLCRCISDKGMVTL